MVTILTNQAYLSSIVMIADATPVSDNYIFLLKQQWRYLHHHENGGKKSFRERKFAFLISTHAHIQRKSKQQMRITLTTKLRFVLFCLVWFGFVVVFLGGGFLFSFSFYLILHQPLIRSVLGLFPISSIGLI